MSRLNYHNILYERLIRQGLSKPIASHDSEEEYLQLFKLLQPVAPVHFTRPGDPPKLIHRTCFDDYGLSSKLRERHRIIKGRFLGGRVGYVTQEDLERYAVAFRKTLTKFKPIHEDVMDLIRNSGGISKEQLKEELPYPSGEITKALQTLQEAFLVYEQQTDTDWDTGWFDFATEWFEFRADQAQYLHAVSAVLLNFITAMVFASFEQMKSWTELNAKILNQVIQNLLDEGKIVSVEITAGQGYMLREDSAGFEHHGNHGNLQSVFMLDKSDFLVRANMSELKERYKGHEVLQYLLIDGEFKGAVIGHWRIGPYDIENILLEIDDEEAEVRKDEMIEAIRKIYSADTTAILRYNGQNM